MSSAACLLLLLLWCRPARACAPGPDAASKALLAPLVFAGRLTAPPERRGAIVRAAFEPQRVYKGELGDTRPVTVEMCRGGRTLRPRRRYLVFAAQRGERRLVAVAAPERASRRRSVVRVLCNGCAKAPTIRGLSNAHAEVHSKLKLKCKLSGNPPPRVVWFKDGIRVKSDGRVKVRSKRRYSHLILNEVVASDSGLYECHASNILGNASSSATVIAMSTPSTDSLWPFKRLPCPIGNYCLNGGECSLYETVGEYVCECAEGYRGRRCENKAISTLNSPPPVIPVKAPHDLDATTRMLQHYWGR